MALDSVPLPYEDLAIVIDNHFRMPRQATLAGMNLIGLALIIKSC